MSFHGYIAERFLSDIDAFTPEQQYRILYDLPDGRYVAPEVKYRMFCNGEKASEALKHVRRLLPMPFSPNTLSQKLYKEPSLIDHERWDEARRRARVELRSRGAYLPCDYMFGERPQMVMAESPDGDETIRPAGINECRSSEVAGCAEEDTPLLIAEQSHRVEIWRLLFDFGKAMGKLLAELSTCK